MLIPALAALALLTRVRVGRVFTAAEIAQAAPFFPAVGILVGLGQILVVRALDTLLPPLLVAVCVLTAAALATGALHLDGLADVADGFGAGWTREERLRIMRDPSVGAYGSVAIVLLVLAKASALAALIERRAAWPSLLLAPALGRWTMVAVSHALSYARPEGGLGAVVGRVSRSQLAVATLIAASACVCVDHTFAVVAWLASAIVTVAFGYYCLRRIGGFTGDTLGANNELTEVACLLTAVVLTR